MDSQLAHGEERGHVMVVAIIIAIFLAAFGFSMVEAVTSTKDEVHAAGLHQQRIFLAESALDAALQDLQRGGDGSLGSAEAPIRLGHGGFYTVATDRGDGTTTVLAVGVRARHARAIRARVRRSKPVFHHAIFAGNSSGDPDYEMKFGGTGDNADQIGGDVYSGGSITVDGHAAIAGTARAKDTINGASGETGVSQTGFEFGGVDWNGPDIVNVGSEFDARGSRSSSDFGGRAMQVPEASPAHIFRLNPDNRSRENAGTVKDDYYLEDPYEELRVDRRDDGSDAPMISLSGEPRQTFYVDGNLWIHNHSAMSFMLESAGSSGSQVTFVVRGNIIFSDSFRLQDTAKDAVAFVALKDDAVEDSGNIYLGDPEFGTLAEVHGYMYAENDFLDINLDARGSKRVRVLGTMSAGNHVAIERDYRGRHSRLTVDWDQRFQQGAVDLPLISNDQAAGGGSGSTVLEAWVESMAAPIGASK